jgi:hypothetical protein
VIRRTLGQRDAQKSPQPKRVRHPPGDAALALDALKIADQKRTKVDAGKKRWPPILLRVELCAQAFDEDVEALVIQQLIQLLIKWMPRSRRQFRVRNPQKLLRLLIFPPAHRHTR